MLLFLVACSFRPPPPAALPDAPPPTVTSMPTGCPSPDALPPVSLVSVDAPLTVPMPLNGLTGLPTVQVEVDGEPVVMIVDTGAAAHVLSSRIADRLGLELGPPADAGSATGAIAFRLATADLELGDTLWADQRFAVIEREHLVTRIAGIRVLEIEGILGWPVLGAGHLTLDFDAAQLTLEPTRPMPDAWPLEWTGAPLVAGRVNGAPARLLLDSGASLTMLHHTLEGPASLQLGETRQIGGGLGDQPLRIRPSRAPVELWTLGQAVRFDRLDVTLDPTGPPEACDDGGLGSDVLQGRVLVVDGPAGQATLSVPR